MDAKVILRVTRHQAHSRRTFSEQSAAITQSVSQMHVPSEVHAPWPLHMLGHAFAAVDWNSDRRSNTSISRHLPIASCMVTEERNEGDHWWPFAIPLNDPLLWRPKIQTTPGLFLPALSTQKIFLPEQFHFSLDRGQDATYPNHLQTMTLERR